MRIIQRYPMHSILIEIYSDEQKLCMKQLIPNKTQICLNSPRFMAYFQNFSTQDWGLGSSGSLGPLGGGL